LSLRLPILIIGVAGTIVFLIVGASGILPWEFAGPVAATLLIGWVLNELKEQFKTKKVPGDIKVLSKPKSEKVPEKVSKEVLENVAGVGTIVDEAVIIQPKDAKEYSIQLKKGQFATIEANADYPITLELINKTELLKAESKGSHSPEVEKSRTNVRNATIEYEAKRNGTWFVHVHNDQRKTPLEVGVIISVE